MNSCGSSSKRVQKPPDSEKQQAGLEGQASLGLAPGRTLTEGCGIFFLSRSSKDSSPEGPGARQHCWEPGGSHTRVLHHPVRLQPGQKQKHTASRDCCLVLWELAWGHPPHSALTLTGALTLQGAALFLKWSVSSSQETPGCLCKKDAVPAPAALRAKVEGRVCCTSPVLLSYPAMSLSC